MGIAWAARNTVLLATLAMAEAITLGAGVTLLGGSLKQSRNVHDYMQGLGNMSGRFWGWPAAPRHLLSTNPTQRATFLANGGWVEALTASTRAVRGPHCQRLRGDELDEMTPEIWDAAQGQPMPARGVVEQVVGSSTHQYPDGTMTRELRMALERKWPVRTWCYKETMAAGGFVTASQVARKRASVTAEQFAVEYELQEPKAEGRAILCEAVDALFRAEYGEVEGEEGRDYTFQAPVWELDPEWKMLDRAGRDRLRARMRARYAAGADWGKLRDHTIIWVLRADTLPMRVVAYANYARRPYPEMFERFNHLITRYEADSAHDTTGLGTVADDYVEDGTVGISLQGARRRNLFSNCVVAIEKGELVSPSERSGRSPSRSDPPTYPWMVDTTMSRASRLYGSLNAPVSIHSLFSSDHQSTASPLRTYSYGSQP